MTNTPIFNGTKVVHDDQPAHIDQYGFEQMESLRYQLERCKQNQTDVEQMLELAQLGAYLDAIIKRYENLYK